MNTDNIPKIFLIVVSLFITLVILIFVLVQCYKVFREYTCPSGVVPGIRGALARNRQRQQQPSNDEAVSHDTDRTRRRRRRRNSRDETTTSDDTDNNERETQSDSGQAASECPVGDSNNDAISGTRNIGEDSGVTLNLEEERVVYSITRNESGNTSNVANDSGVKCESGDDTNDHDDVSSKYDTASSSSVGCSCTGPLP